MCVCVYVSELVFMCMIWMLVLFSAVWKTFFRVNYQKGSLFCPVTLLLNKSHDKIRKRKLFEDSSPYYDPAFRSNIPVRHAAEHVRLQTVDSCTNQCEILSKIIVQTRQWWFLFDFFNIFQTRILKRYAPKTWTAVNYKRLDHGKMLRTQSAVENYKNNNTLCAIKNEINMMSRFIY